MPRKARIDAPGALHHIMARGIERRHIFRSDTDRDDFVERLGNIVSESRTDCYAWSLMPNHFHLLLRTGSVPIATVMRRLMSGYAIGFNRRHGRHGHLFQNRYKSILCDRETYLLELVRYIHLNPLRAKIVQDLKGLDRYPYSGHGAIMGKQAKEWQNIDAVLARFNRQKSTGRARYRRFVEKGIGQGKRPELTGGGLVRSAGGWAGVTALRKSGALFKSDERILGDGDFVQKVLDVAQERMERKYALKHLGVNFDRLLHAVCAYMSIRAEEIMTPGKMRNRVQVRSILCFWANRELGMTMTELSVRLHMTVGAVSLAVQRGGKLESEKGISLDNVMKL